MIAGFRPKSCSAKAVELPLDGGGRLVGGRALGLEARVAAPAEDQPAVRKLLPVVVAAARVVRPVVEQLERLGREHLAAHRRHERPELGRERIGHPVDGEHDRGCIEPVDLVGLDGPSLDDLGSGLGRVLREPPHPERRLERTVARMDEAAGEEPSEPLRDGIEPLGLEAVVAERLVLATQRLELGVVDREPQAPDAAERVAGELRHAIERPLRQRPVHLGLVGAERLAGLVVRRAEAAEREPAVAAACAGGDLPRLEEPHAEAGSGERERAGAAGDPAADDDDVDGA